MLRELTADDVLDLMLGLHNLTLDEKLRYGVVPPEVVEEAREEVEERVNNLCCDIQCVIDEVVELLEEATDCDDPYELITKAIELLEGVTYE